MNEVMVIFMRFIKCVEGTFISNFDIFPMLQKRTVHLRYCAPRNMQTVSEHFSRTADLNGIFICCLVTPAVEEYSGAIERVSPFAASMETIWQQGIDTLAKVFSYIVAEMIMFFQYYFYRPSQFAPVKDLYSTYPQCISVTCQ
jgi:hypothetical protein